MGKWCHIENSRLRFRTSNILILSLNPEQQPIRTKMLADKSEIQESISLVVTKADGSVKKEVTVTKGNELIIDHETESGQVQTPNQEEEQQ